VKFLPSPLREKARPALALMALGLAAVAGPVSAHPPAAPLPQEPKAPQAPKATPAKPTNLPQEPVVPTKPSPPRRLKRSTPHDQQPGTTPTPETPTPETPTAQPSEVVEQPTAAEPPASPTPATPTRSRPRRPRRLGTRGGAGARPSGTTAGEATTVAAESVPDGGGLDGQREEGSEPASEADEDSDGGSPVTRTVERIVEVVPESVGIALGGLLALSLVLAGASLLSAARARRLARQRHELLQEVGLLQTALLPPVPDRIGGLQTSVAYRPAEGPGAGGDFYDALPLPGGRAAFILGDVSGHGRAALERTAFLRYTLRAYLEAGLEPRMALQVGGRVIDERLDGDFATVVLAIHDPASASLTFACAGHPAPIVVGPSTYEPVLPGSAPPLGIGLRTGLRQTTIPLVPGSVVCLFTDGLTEARTDRGILGRPRLGDIVAELGSDARAVDLLEHVATEARLVTDDMAAVLLSPTEGATAGGFRAEQLELSAGELGGNVTRRFLEACDVTGEAAAGAELEAAEVARRFGGAVLNVSFGAGDRVVEVLPRNVESIEAASRRATSPR
jgi:stage II sporulation SpoE-like protein